MAKNNNYFHMLISISEMTIVAARQLEKMIGDYQPDKMPKLIEKMHGVEHEADAKKHHLMKELLSEFMTPIDREDIVTLVQELDDVIDIIEEVFQSFYMYNIREMRPPAKDFADLIIKSTLALKACFDELENFRKSEVLRNKLVEVNVVEEIADTLYLKSMRELYESDADTRTLNTWGIIYSKLEKVCDSCEHVADAIESVVMKNS